MSTTPRETAVQLLYHYVSKTMEKAGMSVDDDTYAEIAECVDSIIEASAEAAVTRVSRALSVSSLLVWKRDR